MNSLGTIIAIKIDTKSQTAFKKIIERLRRFLKYIGKNVNDKNLYNFKINNKILPQNIIIKSSKYVNTYTLNFEIDGVGGPDAYENILKNIIGKSIPIKGLVLLTQVDDGSTYKKRKDQLQVDRKVQMTQDIINNKQLLEEYFDSPKRHSSKKKRSSSKKKRTISASNFDKLKSLAKTSTHRRLIKKTKSELGDELKKLKDKKNAAYGNSSQTKKYEDDIKFIRTIRRIL
jgi:hypothetical protein